MDTAAAKTGAVLSSCGRYRYRLNREWLGGEGDILFIMLNPSTADEEKDDPTIRRCIGFARRWGFRRLWVGNLFALRATDPRELTRVADPVGPDNNEHLVGMAVSAECIVAAWGAWGALRGRDEEIRQIIGGLEHLGLTKEGHPRHPLYVRADTTREVL